jgi:DNA-binding NarL/FixJ family response regulator
MADKKSSCVLLANRHHGLSDGIRGLLETSFETVFMVTDEASLLQGAARLTPPVVILDLSLATGDLAGLLQRVRARSPHSKVLMLSVYDERTVLEAARKAGADAVVLKRSIATDLLPVIDTLLERGSDVPPSRPR